MRALVALGSNLGDRRAILTGALVDLGRLPRTRLVAASPLLDTPPERPGDGGRFLNAAALLETALDPRALLDALLALERRWGRQRRPAGWGARGPRTLDLDLILHGRAALRAPGLELPHPRFHQRRFVLEPAAAVAGDLVDPRSGRTLRRLQADLQADLVG